ncbi:SCP family extracellular subfamily protein [Toxoplasma gondii FOU]|uniref:SCP family extracellular subfamily protein n=3 Tax=Toxoplasma gondii TaxID=5811 RepID=A0A086LEL7_TOXGO|nr:SCP family extracellular subfamily protein [Toxoplasma gondii FOU]PUA91254.1 SCP family extracellular subfamily protein [Toxoplasma gondii TgCATBr9]RQX74613.1 SCP family extracellular subfamily protein [Toxoplasma gondii CAST]
MAGRTTRARLFLIFVAFVFSARASSASAAQPGSDRVSSFPCNPDAEPSSSTDCSKEPTQPPSERELSSSGDVSAVDASVPAKPVSSSRTLLPADEEIQSSSTALSSASPHAPHEGLSDRSVNLQSSWQPHHSTPRRASSLLGNQRWLRGSHFVSPSGVSFSALENASALEPALARLVAKWAVQNSEFAIVADSVSLLEGKEWDYGCPEFTSTWSRCSASCGKGHRFQVAQERRGDSCSTFFSSRGCVGVSGCPTPQEKWSALGVAKPPDVPEPIFLELGEKLPDESTWESEVLADGSVYFTFETAPSRRHFKKRILSDTECGLALRTFFYTGRQRQKETSAFVNEFVSTGAYIPCPGDEEAIRRKSNPLSHLMAGRPAPIAPVPRTGGRVAVYPETPRVISLAPQENELFQFFKERVLKSTPDFASLGHQLKPSTFSKTHLPSCPHIVSTPTVCSTQCGVGTTLFFHVQPDGFNCGTVSVLSHCEAISGCRDLASKWKVLRVTRPDYMPQAIFDELGALLPDETTWASVESEAGRCSIFATRHTRRFRREGGEILGDQTPGAAVRAYFLRELRQTAPGKFECVSLLGLTDDDIIPPIDEAAVDSILLEKHNAFRRRYGVRPLEFNMSLKKFAEYWAWRLEEEGCSIRHSDRETRVAYMNAPEFNTTGENLSISCTLGSTSWADVPAGWFDEVHCYKYGRTGNPCVAQPLSKCNPESHAEGIMVGHFTQLMSDRSLFGACAVRHCRQPCKLGDKAGQKVLTVCNYAEGGNIEGTYPFSRRVAEKLGEIHPEIFQAAEDEASQKACRVTRDIWSQKNPYKPF